MLVSSKPVCVIDGIWPFKQHHCRTTGPLLVLAIKDNKSQDPVSACWMFETREDHYRAPDSDVANILLPRVLDFRKGFTENIL